MTEHQSSVDWSSIADLIADRVVQRFVATASADRWLKVEEAAELLGISLATLARHTANGEVPSFKFGGLRRYLRSKLLALGGTETTSQDTPS
ncbi:MAG: helix-turn-helix domain-containing protein [Planctomycetales bacterium]|nr:helix-turn-helix domain-containing protein [Planctomycetales bacterium]